MSTLFLVCAVFGGVVLVLQLLLGFAGLHHHHAGALHGHHDAARPLRFLNFRALAAGVAFFGLGGLLAQRLGPWLSFPAGLALGIVAVVAVTLATQALLRLEDDGTVRIDAAVGVNGTVYLAIPGAHGAGKVHLTVQNRLVEYQAIAAQGEDLPTGTPVLVVDVVGPDTVSVVRDPLSLPSEVSHVAH